MRGFCLIVLLVLLSVLLDYLMGEDTVVCRGRCGKKFNLKYLADFAQFFPGQREGWVSTLGDRPSQGVWCWVVIGGVVQRQPARLDGRMWEWAEPDADFAPFEVVTHYIALPAPLSAPEKLPCDCGSPETCGFEHEKEKA